MLVTALQASTLHGTGHKLCAIKYNIFDCFDTIIMCMCVNRHKDAVSGSQGQGPVGLPRTSLSIQQQQPTDTIRTRITDTAPSQ